MKKLTAEQLANKNEPDILLVFKTSVEYLLTKVAEIYSKAKGISTFEEFNQRSHLNRAVVSSYPFFVALSNGYSKSLYSLFGDFYAVSFGPISSSVFQFIKESNELQSRGSLSMDHFSTSRNRVQFKELQSGEDFEQLCTQIRESTLSFSSGEVASFKDVYIRSNIGEKENIDDIRYFKSIADAIDHGIHLILSKTNDAFFDGSFNRIIDFTKQFHFPGDLHSISSDPMTIKWSDVDPRPFRVGSVERLDKKAYFGG